MWMHIHMEINYNRVRNGSILLFVIFNLQEITVVLEIEETVFQVNLCFLEYQHILT